MKVGKKKTSVLCCYKSSCVAFLQIRSINFILEKALFWGKKKGKCIWETGDVCYKYSRLFWNYLNTGTAVTTECWYQRALAEQVQAAMTPEQPCTSLSAAHFPNSFLARFWAARQPPHIARSAETPQPGLLFASLRFTPSFYSIFLIPWLPVCEVAAGITGDLGLSLPGRARGRSSAGFAPARTSCREAAPSARAASHPPFPMGDAHQRVPAPLQTEWWLCLGSTGVFPGQIKSFFFFFPCRRQKTSSKIQDLI